MVSEKEVNKSIGNATKWLASEYNYFKEFQSDLNTLQKAITSHSRKKKVFIKEVKEALDDFYRASKSERKFNRFFERINTFKLAKTYEFEANQLSDILSGTVTDVVRKLREAQQLMSAVEQRMNVEGHHLVKAASFYEGEIKSSLEALKVDVDLFVEKWGEQEEWELSEQKSAQLDIAEEKIKKDISKLDEMVKTAQNWIAALSSDLSRAQEIYRNFRFQQIITPKKLQDDLKRFDSPDKQIHHLSLFLKTTTKAFLSGAICDEAKRLIGVIAKKSNLWRVAAEVCANYGLIDNAKKYWENEGDYCLSLYKYKEAAEAYEKAEEWNKAGDAWFKLGHGPLEALEPNDNYIKAAKAYTKVGKEGYHYVGIKLMRIGELRHHSMTGGGFYENAAWIFSKGGFFEEEGKAWVKAAEYPYWPSNHVKALHYKKAMDAFNKSGNQKWNSICMTEWRRYTILASEDKRKPRPSLESQTEEIGVPGTGQLS